MKQADDDLLYFFKNLDAILSKANQKVESISASVDFRVFRDFLIRDISEIQHRLDTADDDYLVYVCDHMYNIIDWARLIIGNRSQVFGDALEKVFEENFGDADILNTIYDTALERWITDKSGQYQLGMNMYSVLDNTIYYRDRFGKWYVIENRTAFDVIPEKEMFENQATIELLGQAYQQTQYDRLIAKWQNQDYQGKLPSDFMEFDEEVTSPEEYFDFTLSHIKNLLKNPVSIEEIERWNGGEIQNLEDTVKLCATALELVQEIRSDDNHTVYLLRDCLVFYELHKTLDIISSEATSSDQLLIGRKLLSSGETRWSYYIATLEALYEAHERYPEDYNKFYNEYVRLLELFEKVSPDFKTIVVDLADYIRNHIDTTKDKIIIFDVGFQGSINLLVKYIIDRHIKPSNTNGEISTDIQLGVGALWSRGLFGRRFMGEYFSFLNRLQFMATSDELYHYVPGSLHEGRVKVKMGDKDWQRKSAVELITLVTLANLNSAPKKA